ncbi:SgcJ/EcaC family oxidoreductase [Actinokineospora soli]|uniref:SgcJ/EcaC family oxidoreductase n=1 Tax=Actinokineospora soli TaxID=1048753 RepID=A0ABW2TLQ1_9PSEU
MSTLTDGDKVAIASLTQKVVAAWAYHDSETFAGVFTEDGSMTLPGVHLKGRKAIQDYLVAAFAGVYKGTQVTGKPIDMRPLGPDAAILMSQGGVLDPGESAVAHHSAIRAAWVVVRQDGQWKLAAYVNTPQHSEGFIAKTEHAAA